MGGCHLGMVGITLEVLGLNDRETVIHIVRPQTQTTISLGDNNGPPGETYHDSSQALCILPMLVFLGAILLLSDCQRCIGNQESGVDQYRDFLRNRCYKLSLNCKCPVWVLPIIVFGNFVLWLGLYSERNIVEF